MFCGLLKRKKIAPTSLLVAKSNAAEADVASPPNALTYLGVASLARLSSAKTPTVSQQSAQLATSAHAAGGGGKASTMPVVPPLFKLPPSPELPLLLRLPPFACVPPLL